MGRLRCRQVAVGARLRGVEQHHRIPLHVWRQVAVPERHLDALVAEQLLHRHERDPTHDEVGGEGVPEPMGGEPLRVNGGGTLKLETNSRERADGLRSLVEERLGLLVTFRVREHMDPVAQLAGNEDRLARPDDPPPAEVVEVMRKLQAEHYRRWLDESIPALGGLTPREAARRKGAPRRELDVLLAEMEHCEAGRPEAERFDVAWLRRELGFERVPEDRS